MIREELITIWTNLKPKLSLYPTLLKNKELIKDALEFHLNKSSEILSAHSSTLARFRRESRLASLSHEFTKEINLSGLDQQFKPTTPGEEPNRFSSNISQPWKDYYYLRDIAYSWNSFLKQRQKNQQITKDCKQLITKLQEYLNIEYPTREDKEKVKRINTGEIWKERYGKNARNATDKELDLSDYINLEYVNIERGWKPKLTKLVLGQLPKLKELHCSSNNLTSLNMKIW